MLQGEKIQTILKSAGVDIEPYWPGLFAKALEGVNPKDLITNIGAGVGAAPAAGKFIVVILVPHACDVRVVNQAHLSFGKTLDQK